MGFEGTAFTIGMIAGAILMVAVVSLVNDQQNKACAQKHNIYECHRVWVPEELK